MKAGLSACPVSGCTKGGCDTEDGGTPGTCLGLLTFVLDLANSSRMVWEGPGQTELLAASPA